MLKAFPIPDVDLRDAYLVVAKQVGSYREKFASRTENIEAVKRYLGPSQAHVPNDDIRDRILTCAKNPRAHGGGWRNTPNGHGRGSSKKVKISKRLQDHYQSKEYNVAKNKAMEGRIRHCFMCGRMEPEIRIQFHHCCRRYDDVIKTPDEYKYLSPVCEDCHPVADRQRKKYSR